MNVGSRGGHTASNSLTLTATAATWQVTLTQLPHHLRFLLLLGKIAVRWSGLMELGPGGLMER